MGTSLEDVVLIGFSRRAYALRLQRTIADDFLRDTHA